LVIVLAKILFEEAPRVRDLRPDVPQALDDLIAQMLAKERDERPPSSAAVAAALKALGTGAMQLADEPPVAAAAPSPALTGSERRVLSVIMLGLEEGPRDVTAETRIESETVWADATLREAAEDHGGHVDLAPDGSTLVLISNPMQIATDQAAQAARC